MTTTQLTPAQHAILAYALEHTGGKIDWFPDNIKGGARKKVLDGLFNRALITSDGTHWFVAAEGYDALGVPRKWATSAPATEATAAPANPKTPRTRENSKQAQMIELLKRPDGATLNQLVEATGWQAHTVRGAMAGALKKKLSLNIVSEKNDGHERKYRITTTTV